MTYLLDTSAWLAHYLREPGGQTVQELFARDDAELVIASVSITEFARCVGASRQGAKVRDILDDYLDIFSRVVPIDHAVARAAFELGERCSGRLPLADALIAATAQSLSATLVHRDAHFSRIPARALKQLPLA
jgi:predicted nucleic acid-binding protein